jgi:hypothetical protein
MPAPLTATDIEDIKIGFMPRPAPAVRPGILNNRHFQLRIHRVDCLKDTSEPIFKDSIHMGGTFIQTALDQTGAQVKAEVAEVKEFAIDKFRSGDSRAFNPPKTFASIDLSDGTLFPKAFAFTVTLGEKDLGGFAKFLDELVQEIEKDVKKELDDLASKAGTAVGGAVGATIGALLGSLVGAVIGALVGFVLGLIADFLKEVAKDDIFTPVTVSLNMPSADFTFPNGETTSPEGELQFEDFGGRYVVHYDLTVVNSPFGGILGHLGPLDPWLTPGN